MATKFLKTECSKCKVAINCKRFGSSPLVISGKITEYCRIVGGYGRSPVESSKLSPESKADRDNYGPCLTIVYIPTIEEGTGEVIMEITKIFSQPVLHGRESVSWSIGNMYPRTHETK